MPYVNPADQKANRRRYYLAHATYQERREPQGRRTAVDGTLCPTGSEPMVWRGRRAWKRECRNGHPKQHPGRCMICRRGWDKLRKGLVHADRR